MAEETGVAEFLQGVEDDLRDQRQASLARHEADAKAIGARLRRARDNAGRTRKGVLEELEDDYGIKMLNSTLAAIENADRGVRLIEAVALASIYGVELTAFTQDHLTASAEGIARVRASELRNMREWIDGRLEGLRNEIGE